MKKLGAPQYCPICGGHNPSGKRLPEQCIWCNKPIIELEKLQPCGHPASEIVSSDEGTSYCGACEREARK